jgi:hypothetical protein
MSYILAGSPQLTGDNNNQAKRRGVSVYNISEIVNVQGRDRTGKMQTGEEQIPIFLLDPRERENIARLNAYVFAVISGRMHRISSLEWTVTRKLKEEDRIAQCLKMYRDIWKENDNLTDMKQLMVRIRAGKMIREELPDVKDDLSNFDASLRRWKVHQKQSLTDSAQEIIDWINATNQEDDFEEYQKKWVFDLMAHGASAQYRQMINGLMENAYLLPGGSVLPLRSRFVGGGVGYVQLMSMIEPRIYFPDELIFDSYTPISSRSYGLIPIEALVNKVAESLLFDRLAAERADGTVPPQKVVVFGENSNNPLGDLEGEKLNVPMDKDEQGRIETKFNEERRNAIVTLSGHGTPLVIDISKADTFDAQSNRQDKLIRDIGLVFGATNSEMNLDGSMKFSSEEVSGSQERTEKSRAIFPIVQIIGKTVTRKWIPYKFGTGWLMEHKTGLSDTERLALEKQMMDTGTYDVNQIREERGDEPYEGEQYSKPQGAQPSQPGESSGSPMFMKSVR